MNINVFSWLLSFFPNWERVVNKNLGVKGKCPKVTYLIFLTGFHWRISLLSRASRLGTVFNAGLRDSGLSCLSLFVFSPEWNGYRPSATRLVQKLPFFVLLPLRGRGPYFRLGSPPQSFGFIFSFPFRCPATQGHLSANICVTHNHF